MFSDLAHRLSLPVRGDNARSWLWQRGKVARSSTRRPLRPIGAALAVWLIVGQVHLRRFAHRLKSRSAGHTPTPNIAAQIRSELLSWPGVTAVRHRYGGVEYRLGKRELGHLHGDYLADLPFPVRVRGELVAANKAMPHHILPLSGWVSYPIRDADAVPGAVALFRLAYDRATAKGTVHRRGAEAQRRAERTGF